MEALKADAVPEAECGRRFLWISPVGLVDVERWRGKALESLPCVE